VVSDWRVGWNDSGEWYKYTRTFPTNASKWYAYARLSSGGSSNRVQLAVGTDVIGEFRLLRPETGT